MHLSRKIKPFWLILLQPHWCVYFFLLSECLSLCCSLSEVLYKWSLLQAWWAGVSDDRGRGPSKSSMDEGWHLAHLRWETGSTLLDAGASLLWKESPYSVCLSLSLCPVYERNLYVCVVICLDNSVSNPQLHPVQRVTHTFALLQVQQV